MWVINSHNLKLNQNVTVIFSGRLCNNAFEVKVAANDSFESLLF